MNTNQSCQKELPDKLYFKIGEVSTITAVPTYVLRFWETEFKMISPKRTSTGQRLYKKNDVEQIFKIKKLLYEKKFTIEGARKHLTLLNKKKGKPALTGLLKEIRMELESIRDMLVK